MASQSPINCPVVYSQSSVDDIINGSRIVNATLSFNDDDNESSCYPLVYNLYSMRGTSSSSASYYVCSSSSNLRTLYISNDNSVFGTSSSSSLRWFYILFNEDYTSFSVSALQSGLVSDQSCRANVAGTAYFSRSLSISGLGGYYRNMVVTLSSFPAPNVFIPSFISILVAVPILFSSVWLVLWRLFKR